MCNTCNKPRVSRYLLWTPKYEQVRISHGRFKTYVTSASVQKDAEGSKGLCSNLDGPRHYHTKQSKSERERQIPYDITYMRTLKYDTGQYIYETKADSQTRRQTCGCQGKVWEFGISRSKLTHIGWIHNKVLLYGTGNWIPYPVIKHDGKEHEKEYAHVSHSAGQQKLTQHCKSTTLQKN